MGRLLASPMPAAHRWATDLLNERTLAIADAAQAAAAKVDATPAAVALAGSAAGRV